MLLQVILERRQAHDEGTTIAERPQAQIHPEHKPVLGPLIQVANDLARQALEIFLVVHGARPARLAGLGKQQDKIHIGGKIQLAAAKLAHGHDYQRHCPAALIQGHPENWRKMARGRLYRRLYAGIREVRQVMQRGHDLRSTSDGMPGDAAHRMPSPGPQHRASHFV